MTRRTFVAFALAGPVAIAAVSFAVSAAVSPPPTVSPGTRLLGWNNLGMHCMDADFGIFSILPPYNTIHAQLVVDGALVRNPAGMTVTYEAVTDANGSINTASSWKTNFWQNAQALFGATPAAETGLAGKAMPGAANAPQAMTWDAAANGWFAEGIPITPTDDAGHRNAYPMMRLVARDARRARRRRRCRPRAG